MNDKPEKDFFISYTQSDQQWAERIASILEAAGYSVVLQAWDFHMGSNFIDKMDKALKETEQTIVVVSEKYFQSKYTKAEWTAAFSKDPDGSEGSLILVRIEDYTLEGLLRSRSYIDLVGLTPQEQEEKLLSSIKDRKKSQLEPSRLETVPIRHNDLQQSNNFLLAIIQGKFSMLIDRSQERAKIVDHLLMKGDSESSQIIALWGESGIGKTALASLVCSEFQVQSHFSGGFFWISLERTKSLSEGIKSLQRQLLEKTTKKEHRFIENSHQTIEEIAANCISLWQEKPSLVILDSLPCHEFLNAFLSCNSKHCRWLITTKTRLNFTKSHHSVKELRVKPLSLEESVSLLTYSLLEPKGLISQKAKLDQNQLEKLVGLLYEWPTLINSVKHQILERIETEDNISEINKEISIIIEEIIEEGWSNYLDSSIFEEIERSFKYLDKAEEKKKLFKELMIFPANHAIPLSVVEKLWNLDNRTTKKICQELRSLSLLEFGTSLDCRNSCNSTITIYSYLSKFIGNTKELKGQLTTIHRKLIEAYQKRQERSEVEDEYLNEWYSYHQQKADL